jgi:hypothetical protein
VALAREAATSGDRISAENFYQHAEHYFRISNACREGSSQERLRPTTPADVANDSPETGSSGDGIGAKNLLRTRTSALDEIAATLGWLG